MNDDAIDQAILSMLSAAGGRWRKVAMVISRVAGEAGNVSGNEDDRYELVARRIEALVSDGRLVGGARRHQEVAIQRSSAAKLAYPHASLSVIFHLISTRLVIQGKFYGN